MGLFHSKYGLSPINVDRVDLERFPSISNATTYLANLSAGDAVYIPDGWWHVVSLLPGSKTAALNPALPLGASR